MEEIPPSRLLAQEGLPPLVRDGVGLVICTGSVKEIRQLITGSVTNTVSIQTSIVRKMAGWSVHEHSVAT